MNLYVRTLSCLALLGTSLAALSQYRPAWAAGLDLDWWSLPELREQIRRGHEFDATLDRAGEGVLDRATAKEQATQGLLAGRLNLTETAARFRALNASSPWTVPPLPEAFPGATEEERACRQVIAWAECASEYAGPPGAGRQTRRRLEAELNVLKEKNHGAVPLPE
jgi:hypothetical protein